MPLFHDEDEVVIPTHLYLAAKRAFIRTTAQSYATALAGGISATTLLALMHGEASWVEFAITWVVALLSPLLAGAASYLKIIGSGVPEEYQISASQHDPEVEKRLDDLMREYPEN